MKLKLIYILILLSAAIAFAQKKNVDERFTEAREMAFAGERNRAIDSLNSILKSSPDYNDVRVFLGRVYAWEKNYTQAKDELQFVLSKNENHKEAIDALSDVEFWSGNPHEALSWVNKGLEIEPGSEKLLEKKEKLLKALGYGKEESVVQKPVTTDEKFAYARQLAFTGKRSDAIDSAKAILNQNPDHTDARIFLARVYSWEKQYDNARENLHLILEKKENHEDALNALIDVEMWSGNYSGAVIYSDRGIDFYPLKIGFMLKKAKALEKMKRYDEAEIQVQNILQIDPSNQDAEDFLIQLEVKTQTKVSLGYSGNYFKQSFTPWHNAYISAGKKFGFGSLILRINYAERFSNNGFQYEVDSYFPIMEGTYAYANAGFSGDKIFPKMRFGFEPYQKLPNSFEASFGIRYLNFTTSKIWIFTGSLGKYISNYWISFRPFITPKQGKTSFSGSIIIRMYLSGVDNYLSLQAGLGFIPFANFTVEEFGRVDSRKIGLDYNFSINPKLIFKTGLSYENEEYRPGKTRDKFGFNLSIQQGF